MSARTHTIYASESDLAELRAPGHKLPKGYKVRSYSELKPPRTRFGPGGIFRGARRAK